MDKIETRGGSRPGCGRKPVHPGIKRVQTTISVSQETRERIRILAKNKNIRIGRVIDRVVEELYNKHCNEEIGNIWHPYQQGLRCLWGEDGHPHQWLKTPVRSGCKSLVCAISSEDWTDKWWHCADSDEENQGWYDLVSSHPGGQGESQGSAEDVWFLFPKVPGFVCFLHNVIGDKGFLPGAVSGYVPVLDEATANQIGTYPPRKFLPNSKKSPA